MAAAITRYSLALTPTLNDRVKAFQASRGLSSFSESIRLLLDKGLTQALKEDALAQEIAMAQQG